MFSFIAFAIIINATPAHGAPITSAPEAKRLINRYLTREERQLLVNVFDSSTGLGPLSPQVEADGSRVLNRRCPSEIRGEPVAIYRLPTRTGPPNPNEIATFLKELPLDVPTRVVVPPGKYREFGLDIPDNLELVAEGPNTILAAPSDLPEDATGYIVSLGTHSILKGFTIDGRRRRSYGSFCLAEGNQLGTCRMIHGVLLRERSSGAGVVNNIIQNLPYGYGVYTTRPYAAGAREANVCFNRIRRSGRSGVLVGSGWLVANNIIQISGVDSLAAGGGEEGILTATRTSQSIVRNNLVMSFGEPRGRHAFAMQTSFGHVVSNNILVARGPFRGLLVLADGSDNNVVFGNLLIGAADEHDSRPVLGLHVFGSKNTISGNAIFGSHRGISTYSQPDHGSRENLFLMNTGRVRYWPSVVGQGNEQRGNTIETNPSAE